MCKLGERRKNIISKKSFWQELKKCFKTFICEDEMFAEECVVDIQMIGLETAILQRECFRQRLKVISKDRAIIMQQKLQAKDMQVSTLTDEELDEMIALYKAQINEKKKYLNS